jgi:hypothetical protein
MRYVLDASAAAPWVLPNPLTPKALQLRADYQRHIHELIRAMISARILIIAV